ncbi:TPA: hypothetical protein I7682_17640 [Vibrio vulnificus]|nr:hypothetical protein [Vibrio vulnificus]
MNNHKLYVRTETELLGAHEVREATLCEVGAHLGDDHILMLAEAIIAKRYTDRGGAYTSPSQMSDLVKVVLQGVERERFVLLGFDNQHQFLKHTVLFEGTIDQSPVYPREVVKWCLENNIVALVLAHNHPTNVLTPSEADRRITRKLSDSLSIVGVRILDHFIVGQDANRWYSFSEHNLM